MTLKSFWTAVGTYLCFFAVILILVFTKGKSSALPKETFSEEDAFLMRISTLEATEAPIWRIYDSLKDVMESESANLIVRCKATERGEMTVYDPLNFYTIEVLSMKEPGFYRRKPLWEAKRAASSYISTPYEMEITEVFLSESKKTGNGLKKGDTFTFYANYGYIGSYYVRYENYPFFKVGEEYVMFLNYSLVDGEPWYDLVSLGTVFQLSEDLARSLSSLSPPGDPFIKEVSSDMFMLEQTVSDLYQQNPYPLSPVHIKSFSES